MDNFYNSSDLCLLLKKSGVYIAGTQRLNRKNIPLVLKEEKLKRVENIAVQSQGMMVWQWINKKPIVTVSPHLHPSADTPALVATLITAPLPSLRL
jgi:hypothetical protein